MMNFERQIAFVKRHEQKLIVVLVLLFVVLFGGFAILKYFRFGYDVLDLAIYDQVMKFMLQGEWFRLTIHPGSYLGDHFEPMLIALFPFYRLAPHPITLLLLQVFAVAASAFPLARLSRAFNHSAPVTFAVVFWFLFNPITQHLTLFEFHALPFALPLIFWALCCYQEKRWRTFLLLLLASLTVREDVSLFWMFFAFFALLQRRSIRWTLIPLLISITWFIAAITMIRFFNPDESYKFFVYYQHLGASLPELITNFFTHPQRWLFALFRLQNILYLLMIGIFSFGLPLFALPALLPLLPLLAQLFLSSFGGSEVTLFSHYSSLALPPLFLTSLLGLSHLASPTSHLRLFSFRSIALRIERFRRSAPFLLPILVVAIMLYSIATISPIPTMLKQIFSTQSDRAIRIQTLLDRIPQNAIGLGSFTTLTSLTDRPELYSLHYAWRGTRQFSDQPFPFPEQLDYAVLDTSDLLALGLQFDRGDPEGAEYTANQGMKLQTFLTSRGLAPALILHDQVLWAREGNVSLFRRFSADDFSFISIGENFDWSPPNALNTETINDASFVMFDLTLRAARPLNHNAQLHWKWKDLDTNQTLEEIMPLTYGLFPSSKWNTDDAVSTTYRLQLPARFSRSNAVELSARLVQIRGHVGLNPVRSTENKFDKITESSETFVIGIISPNAVATP